MLVSSSEHAVSKNLISPMSSLIGPAYRNALLSHVSPLQRRDLLLALATTVEPIRYIRWDGRQERLSAANVAAIVARGGVFTWRQRNTGVRKVTQHPEVVPIWVACYRTTEAAAFGPQPGTMDRYESRPSL